MNILHSRSLPSDRIFRAYLQNRRDFKILSYTN